MSTLNPKAGNLDAYQPINNDYLLYDEINGANIEGGGRIIVAVDGVEISSMAELDAEKNKKSPGDSITLTVYRNTKKLEISVVLSEATNE